MAPTDRSLSLPRCTEDANPAGNVHGGCLLRMVDEGALIAATRHANHTRPSSAGPHAPAIGAALARIEVLALQTKELALRLCTHAATVLDSTFLFWARCILAK
jgi:hypothetical protein